MLVPVKKNAISLMYLTREIFTRVSMQLRDFHLGTVCTGFVLMMNMLKR